MLSLANTTVPYLPDLVDKSLMKYCLLHGFCPLTGHSFFVDALHVLLTKSEVTFWLADLLSYLNNSLSRKTV